MDITKRVRHDHAEIRSIAHRILNSNGSQGDESRDTLFKTYDREVRQHLDAFEDVFITRMSQDRVAADAATDIASEHRAIRKGLRALNRRRKESPEWTDEFRTLTTRFESLCHRHEALVTRTCSVHDSAQLDHDYETVRTKSRRSAPWGRIILGLGAAGLIGGIAYASRDRVSTDRLKSFTGRRREQQRETDLVIVETNTVELVPIPVPVASSSAPQSHEAPRRTEAEPMRSAASEPMRSSGSSSSMSGDNPTGAPTKPEQTAPTDEHVTELTGSAHPSSDFNLSSSNANKDRLN